MKYEIRRLVETISYVDAENTTDVQRYIATTFPDGESLVTKAEIVAMVGPWTVQATEGATPPMTISDDDIAILEAPTLYEVPYIE